MLISHHGQYEFGSPKLPMFREALVLHYLDDLDSKMAAVRAALESEQGEGNWTAFNGALARRILRADRFLAGLAAPKEKEAAKPEQPSAAEEPAENSAKAAAPSPVRNLFSA